MTEKWHTACSIHELTDDDVLQFDLDGKVYAVVRSGDDFTTMDGMCTHDVYPLAEGFVIDGQLECPLHQGRFCVKTGKALGPPVHEDLVVYPTKVENELVMVKLSG